MQKYQLGFNIKCINYNHPNKKNSNYVLDCILKFAYPCTVDTVIERTGPF